MIKKNDKLIKSIKKKIKKIIRDEQNLNLTVN